MLNRVLALLALVWFTSCTSSDEQGVSPRLMDITESVYASVSVRPELIYSSQPTRPGIIHEIFVEEGDEVKAGQLLYSITPGADFSDRMTAAELQLEEATANYAGESSMLDNLQAEMNTLRQQVILDSTNYQRQKRLWDQNIGKRVDFERAELTYTASKEQYRILQNRYEQTALNLQNTYRRALSGVNMSRNQLGDFEIRSSIDGKVYSINKEVGELITSQQQFAEIGSADRFIVEMNVDEVDIAKLSIGDTVLVALEAYPDEVFRASTTFISPKRDEQTQTFRVESRFEQQPEALFNGLSGEANIVIGRRSNALVIPAEYLLPGNQVNTEDGMVVVSVGVKNLEMVEILSGIDTTTVLIQAQE